MKLNKIFVIQNKFWISTLITLIVLLLVLWANTSYFGDFFSRLNLYMQNWLFQSEFSTEWWKIANKSILVVEIDDRTLQDQDKWWLWRWQEFRRKYYAQVIDNLKKDWALVIWVDILFSEESIYYKDDDRILAESIKNAWNVILAFHKRNNIYPINELKKSSVWMWDVFTIVNSVNQNVYSIFPFYNNGNLVSFSIKVLQKFYEETTGIKQSLIIDPSNPKHFGLNEYKIPYSRWETISWNKDILINYLIKPLDYNKLSFIHVYNHRYNPSLVKDKIVFIWSTATALHDEYQTPVGIIPWVYTHVNAVNTIMNGSYLSYFNRYSEIWIFILFIYLITILWIYDKRKYYFVSSLFILIILYFFFYIYAYTYERTIFSYPIQFYVWILLSFISVSIYRYLYEDKGKRLLQNALSQYLAEDLVKSVLVNYEKVKLWWQKKENTIFFSDIAWFTNISEKMEPEELVHFLSQYLKEVSDVIIDNKWFINKYEWDAVMALWGAFWQENKQAYLACVASLEQQKVIIELNKSFKEKIWIEIAVRMWINKWPVIVGNIWSEWRKIEFTALWDHVNLASRLEWINKFYNTLICVSASVKNSAWDDFIFRYLDKIKVKWKQNAVEIYELIGYKNEISIEKINLIKEFDKAIDLYKDKEFDKAKKIFIELNNLGDKPSLVFIERCELFKNNPPQEDWDSSWEFSEK